MFVPYSSQKSYGFPFGASPKTVAFFVSQAGSAGGCGAGGAPCHPGLHARSPRGGRPAAAAVVRRSLAEASARGQRFPREAGGEGAGPAAEGWKLGTTGEPS